LGLLAIAWTKSMPHMIQIARRRRSRRWTGSSAQSVDHRLETRNFAAATVSQRRYFGLEASALQHTARLPALAGRSPLLRLQSDERLVALIRRGNNGAF
jgi:hypothetical protein